MDKTVQAMKKVAFVFPGQGSQAVGMSRSFYDSSAASREAFEEANTVLGYDIKDIAFSGPKETLDLTENTQPSLLVASIAALRALKERVDFTPAYYAGHSLGEYTALVAAGTLSFRDAVRIVHLRGKFMQESVPEGAGKMCAIIGLDIDSVKVVCDSASIGSSVVVPANINSPEQVVISGHAAAVDIAAGLAKERGAKMVIPLKVSAPSHSPLMEDAARKLSDELKKVKLNGFLAPVITNVEASPCEDASRAVELLAKQLTSPVRWVDTIRRMKKEGVTHIIEIGPGKVLTGLVKRIDKEIAALSLSEAADLENVFGALRGL